MSNKLTIVAINSNKPQNSRLTAINFDGYIVYNNSKYRAVIADCICGKTVRVIGSSIANGRTKSCGCYNLDNVRTMSKKYTIPSNNYYRGLYGSYSAMMKRCYDKKNIGYKNYGLRGVVVCEEWKNNYDAFAKWALENGWKKSLELDKDKKGNGLIYSPDTCCWLTHIENNMYKKRSNFKLYEFDNQKLTLGQISKIVNVPYSLLYTRICGMGYSLQESINMGSKILPPNAWKNRNNIK